MDKYGKEAAVGEGNLAVQKYLCLWVPKHPCIHGTHASYTPVYIATIIRGKALQLAITSKNYSYVWKI